ncbi:MAG: hypothetical protein ACRDRV_16575 [Pseudonocardiaceae bacterium]
MEKPEEITAYRNILEALAQTALGGQSRELLAALANKFYGNRGDHDIRA